MTRFAALALAVLLPAAAIAQSATAPGDVPIPRLDPRAETGQVAGDAGQASGDGGGDLAADDDGGGDGGDGILLQGANSPFADAGADSPRAATRPLAQPATVPRRAESTARRAPASVGAAPASIRPGSFTLEARMWAGGPTLGEGVKWRIFDNAPGTDGKLPLIGEADGGLIHIRLEPGTYFIHAAYGRAGAMKRIDVTDPTGGEVLVLNAGGMRLLAVNGRDQQLRPGEARFDVFAPDEGGSDERFLIVSNAPPGRVISLNAGTYHVICYYGNANAIVRADIRVDPGQLTEATIYQRAARMTLKLVDQHGGEAIANTEWSIATKAGENVVESVGAFPNVVLSEGDYVAIARNNGRIFESDFTVRPGLNRDVEVLARQ